MSLFRETQKILSVLGTIFCLGHSNIVATETPLPSKRLVTKSRGPCSDEQGPFSCARCAQSQCLLIDAIFAVDIGIEQFGYGDHSLIVIENPPNLSTLGLKNLSGLLADLGDHHKGKLAR